MLRLGLSIHSGGEVLQEAGYVGTEEKGSGQDLLDGARADRKKGQAAQKAVAEPCPYPLISTGTPSLSSSSLIFLFLLVPFCVREWLQQRESPKRASGGRTTRLLWLREHQLESIKLFFPKACGVSRVEGSKVLSVTIHVLRPGLCPRGCPNHLWSPQIVEPTKPTATVSAAGLRGVVAS